ncbi:MAG TPA: glycosyltransferase family 39 protein [Candidatus Binatia bacterium]|nr:glycosyltransferase family 39 protein [Candidatus Binatia bacterium]
MVGGHGFSSAFHDTSQPTAWLAPAYPALLAAIFLLFGTKSAASAVVAILLNTVFSSLTVFVLIRLGRDHFGRTAGLLAGWMWCVAPLPVYMPSYLWETCLSGLTLSFAFMLTIRLQRDSPWRAWICCGAFWGFAALLNPALLAPLPVLVLTAARRAKRWKEPFLLAIVCALMVAPWTIRNARVLHRFIPVRSNSWAELYFGNIDFSVHPTGPSMKYQREGEIVFLDELKQRTLNFVKSDPASFLLQTERRVVHFWMSPPQFSPYPIALLVMAVGGMVFAWTKTKLRADLGAVLVFYPLIYYVTYALARYRYPIEPMMCLLGAYFLWRILGVSRKPTDERRPDETRPDCRRAENPTSARFIMSS